jgi:hypothetical protein
MFSNLKIIPAIVAIGVVLQSCKKEETPMTPTPVDNSKVIEMRFYPKWGTAPLTLNTRYTNAAGDTVQLSAIKFYVSEAALVDSTGKEFKLTDGDAHAKASHGSGLAIWLVDMSATTVAANGYYPFQAKGAPGKYRGVKFSVGVPFDENHKDAATQGEPLGPNSGMYWSWNPGYIFHKIEGRVDSAGQQKVLNYHLGEDNRKATIRLASFTVPVTEFVVGESNNVFKVDVDYSKLFIAGLNNPSLPMNVKMNVAERSHHVGPKNLADRIFANSQLMFAQQP